MESVGVGRGRRVQGGRMLQEFEFDSTETNSNTTRIQIKTTTPSSRPQLFNSIDLYLNPSTNIKRVRSSYLPATAQETTPIYYTSRKGGAHPLAFSPSDTKSSGSQHLTVCYAERDRCLSLVTRECSTYTDLGILSSPSLCSSPSICYSLLHPLTL